MAGKSAHGPEGLHDQIDELDALLDRLLKLPLGPASISETPPSPTLKLAQPGDSLLEVMDEALEIDTPVLRLPAREEPSEPVMVSKPKLAPLTSDFGTLVNLGEPPGVTEDPGPAILSLPEQDGPINRLDPEEIPWLDDEPSPPPPSEALPEAPAPLLASLTTPTTGGPRIEIIQGSLRTSLLLPDGSLAETAATESPPRIGLLRRPCWLCTWTFDGTAGRLLPGLRRKAGRRFLALAGLGMLTASGYLAWKWWW